MPIYGRHPIGVAQLARTAQSTLGGRFTLGIGAASRNAVATSMGLAWERPLAYTREFLEGLMPLLAGRLADVDGDEVTTHAELNITAPGTPVLLATGAADARARAGRTVEGTSVGQCGPARSPPTSRRASGRRRPRPGAPTPRILALIRLCVTDDHAGGYALAQETASWYRTVPSYEKVQDMEGLEDPAELHLIGSWSASSTGSAATPRPASPTSGSRSPPRRTPRDAKSSPRNTGPAPRRAPRRGGDDMTSDIEAIRRLHHTYAYTFDGGDFDAFAALFEHGTLHLRGVDDPATGAAAVRRLVERCVILYDGTPATDHLMHNLVVDFDDDDGPRLDVRAGAAGPPGLPASDDRHRHLSRRAAAGATGVDVHAAGRWRAVCAATSSRPAPPPRPPAGLTVGDEFAGVTSSEC